MPEIKITKTEPVNLPFQIIETMFGKAKRVRHLKRAGRSGCPLGPGRRQDLSEGLHH
jgi:hypothetical protein